MNSFHSFAHWCVFWVTCCFFVNADSYSVGKGSQSKYTLTKATDLKTGADIDDRSDGLFMAFLCRLIEVAIMHQDTQTHTTTVEQQVGGKT